MEMLRAGAVGYLVKGTTAEDIVESIHRVASGGPSLSAEVVGGSCTSCRRSCGARRSNEERSERAATRSSRFVDGDGISIHVQPIVELEHTRACWVRSACSVPVPPASAPGRMVRRGRRARARRPARAGDDRSRARLLAPRCPLRPTSRSTAHSAPRGAEELARAACAPSRHTPRRGDHRARAGRGLRRARAARSRALRALGVRIAIDDAGAGYASLRHTLALAPDIVKVDISLTPDDRHGPRQARVGLGADLVRRRDGHDDRGRGHRDRAPAQTLVDLGVRYGQGFHLAEPGRSAR